MCLGDVIGYGADPNLCSDFIKEKAFKCVLGNHDYALLKIEERKFLNDYARKAVEWTEKVIRKENRKFFEKLDFKENLGNDVLLVHSAPSEPESWEYIFSLEEAIFEFQKIDEKIIFFGHSHIPCVFKEKEEKEILKYGFVDVIYEEKENFGFFMFKIENNSRYLINPGSVGQPRDGDPRASFVIFDKKKRYVYFYRIPYDVERARNKIVKNNLPQFLGDRLLLGR